MLQAKERTRIEARRKHMQAFVDRFRYKASKARQAQSRLKAIAKLAPIPEVIEAPHVVLRFPQPKLPPPPLITLERAAAGYGDHVVLDRLDLRLDPDDRIALLGAQPQWQVDLREAARRRARAALRRGDPGAEAAGRLFRAASDRSSVPGRQRAAASRAAPAGGARGTPAHAPRRLRPDPGQGETSAAASSLAAPSRLTLALISAEAPQFLVLDEPTNHLDIDARDALIEAINGFAGAVLLISHDPHLIELTADQLWLVEGGRVQPYDGDLADYRHALLGRSAAGATAGPASGGNSRRAERQRQAEVRARLAPLRQQAKAAERELERLTAERAALAARLADGATYERAGRRDRRPDEARGRTQGGDRGGRAPLARCRGSPLERAEA